MEREKKGVEGRGGDGAKNYVQMFLKQDGRGLEWDGFSLRFMLVVGSDFTRINDCLEFLKIDRNNSD